MVENCCLNECRLRVGLQLVIEWVLVGAKGRLRSKQRFQERRAMGIHAGSRLGDSLSYSLWGGLSNKTRIFWEPCDTFHLAPTWARGLPPFLADRSNFSRRLRLEIYNFPKNSCIRVIAAAGSD